MGEAASYQLNTQVEPVAADAIVLGQAAEDLPNIRVVVRASGTLNVMARTADGKEPTGSIAIRASYGPETTARIAAAEQANQQPSAHFTEPRLMQTHPADQPWKPTFLQVAPGEPLIVTIQSDLYAAEPQTVTLAAGETKSIEIVLQPVDAENKK